MLERAEELKQRVRETPLSERLTDARRRIGKMCSEGRPPHMTIPVQYDDDDFYISTTLSDAQATIADLQGQLEVAQNKQTALEKSVRNLTEFYDKYNGTPCEQIRHQQEVELLQQRVAQLEGKLVSMTESRDAWQKSQEGTEKAYMALATQIPSERFDYDPVNLALLESAKEQEEIGRKQIADLQSSLSRLTQKYAYIEKEAALAYEKIATLQADHARVLGELADTQERLMLCEHELGSVRLDRAVLTYQLEHRASLPAQRAKLAQGGA